MHCLTVIYPHPDDPEAFKSYYEEKHLPLAARLPGLKRYHYAYPDAVGGGDVFCIFQAYFEDGASMGAAMESGVGGEVAQDVANYSPKGAQIFHFPIEV
ncbi:EthD family reductase [Hoeflea sp. WL0058]|uniref:EthD family reductase n=1 Tax=Flavimaribacter sediminis TaxID=2865987 RepID=A0AAE2ZK85_9HYPH|nr:EthD family reductase [Flavimaribacter sediminis]MBW8638058.1 EthD family reductase [Flavimaribacter sediminis]